MRPSDEHAGASRIALIQHVPFEGPGAIWPIAAEAGFALDVRRMWAGDPLPTAEEIDGLVVMGGPMGVGDLTLHPHLRSEIDLLSECAEAGLPVLGVCLGAQLLARALGAEVRTGQSEEVGIGSVTLTGEGRADGVLGPSGSVVPVLHWHKDTFEIPDGAVRLASSPLYPNQAFRAGASYGLQFHVELDDSLARSLAPHLPSGVQLAADDVARVESSGKEILERLFAGFANAGSRPSQPVS
jgi:GMP synthase-like glutamine amidotransferase